jgi:hypothetical protein
MDRSCLVCIVLCDRSHQTLNYHTICAPRTPCGRFANQEFVIIEKCAEYPDGLKIMYNQRGMPVYDKYAAYDTKISMDVVKVEVREFHMQEATRDLKRAIQAGEISSERFTQEQLIAIMKEKPRIPDYTWHHHEDVGRMQLIPKVLHDDSRHIGGFKLWYEKFNEVAK